MDFLETLPPGCPPPEAKEINSESFVYRLVKNNPPTMQDFQSLRSRRPAGNFGIMSECHARGLSVWANAESCENARRLTALRTIPVCRIGLSEGAGYIQETFQLNHRTWWPLKAFDILDNCEMVQE